MSTRLPVAAAAHLRLQHLLLCRALVRHGTVREAAQALHRTQSAVTKMLQELESSLGVRLFERGRLGTRPTASGRAFLHRAEVMLNEWDILRDELQAIEEGDAGLLRVGATPIMMLALLPRALADFLARRPGTLVRFREASIHELLLALDGGELDCAVGRFSGELLDSERVRGLRIERLYDETLCVIAGANQPIARRRSIGWQHLAAERWVLPPPELATRQLINTEFIRAGVAPPRPLLESSSFATSVSLAWRLGALAVVPLDAGRFAQAQGLVRVLRTPLSDFSAPISIVQRPSSLQGEVYDDFLSAVRRAGAAQARG
ncbi:MAG: LysR family transcriptional regulator [Burkholderiaceae bacterium]|nr:LysR family transcriptional regulator [Burkholderiaceae bacterium]